MECSSLAFGEVGVSNLLPNLISVVVVANYVVGRGNQAGLLLLKTTQVDDKTSSTTRGGIVRG